MGVAPDDRRLELAVASDPHVPMGPDFVMERMEKALGEMSQFAAEMQLP